MLRFRTCDACVIVIASALAASAANAQPPAGARGTARDAGHVISGSPRVKKFDRVPPEFVWKGVEGAYRQADITPTFIERSMYAISYAVSPAGAKIGNTKIEDVFDCGGDKKSPLAATMPLSVIVRSVVQAAGEGAEVTTTVEATPISTDSGTVAPVCKSRGKLERKLEPQIKTMTVVRRR